MPLDMLRLRLPSLGQYRPHPEGMEMLTIGLSWKRYANAASSVGNELDST